MNIAIIGKKECIIGFRALGIKIYPVKDSEEVRKTLLDIKDNDLAIVFITESLAQDIYDTIDELNEQIHPAITIIPEPSGPTGFASKVIRDAMLRAVGTDVTAR